MRKLFARSLGILLAIVMLASMVLPTFAATYRNGAQSGPSSSYAGSRYYENYKRVPITGDNRTDLIAIALSQLGYQEGKANGYFSGEISGSANYVEFSYNMGDLGLGYGGSDYPWCASFVSWCLYQSRCTDQNTYKDLGRYHVGDYKYIWKEISCSQWVRQLKGAGCYKYSAYEGGSYTPKYGDLVFFQNSGGVAHIGICLYVSGGRIYTVEGNTSDSAGLEPNGGGVYFKNYSLSTSYINGYGVLPYKSDSSVTKIDYSGKNPTPGLYIANAGKYIYGSETDTTYDYVLPRFTMFEVTQVCSNGRLKITGKCSTGETVTGYILNNSDRVIQLSSTETNAAETARTNLQTQIKAAANVRHYNYTEAKLIEIGTAYDNAVALVNDASASADAMNAAAATLRNLMGQTGSNTIAYNNKGVYVNGRNGYISAGDCFIYSYLWNNGLITVDNANIRYTINVVCTWDAEREINVVKSITYGSGSSTPSIQLGESDWLIACHDWESGVSAGDNPVEYSGTNYEILSNLSVGDGVVLYGATALNANSDVKPGAYLKFVPKESLRMTAENQYVGNGQAVLFTPDFNGGLLTPTGANIHQTLNVVAEWDNDNSAWVVTQKFAGNGNTDASSNIQISDGQVVIACHAGTSTSHAYAWRMLNAAQVGQKVIFSGISPTDDSTSLSRAANISFVDMSIPEIPEEDAPTNLSAGKEISVQKPGTAAHTANLTDGVYVSNLDFTGGWFGFMGNPASANWNTDENGVGTITMDLGGRYSLDSLRMHVYAGANEASVASPSYVKVYLSNNGTSYGYVGELSMDAAATEAYWAELENAGVTGRYVKLEVGPAADGSAWVFVNELEVYGTEPVDGHNVALGTSYEGTPSGGYNGSLTDGIIGETIDDGSWYGIDTFLGTGSVVIDLNERFQISSVKAHIFAGDILPADISVSISSDGVNYAKVGTLSMDGAANAPFWAELTADTMVGRYVMLEASSNGELVLLSEVQICGMPYVRPADSNIAMGKDTIVSPYADSPFTALLNDGLASNVFQYNVNNDAWFGFRNTGDAATGNVTNNRGIITIDLGGQAEITGVAVHLFAGANDAGAVQPQYVNVYYSADGVAYDYAGYINPDLTQNGAYWLSVDYTTAPVNARFLKLALGTNVGDLVLLNEVKVSGVMLTEEDDNKPGSVSVVTLAGSFNGWNSTPNMVNVDENVVTATVALTAGTHEFKILYCNQWLGNNGTIYDTTGNTGWVMEEGTNNCVLNASHSGNYLFTFSKEDNTVKVAYLPDPLYLRGSFNEWGTVFAMENAGNGIYKANLTLQKGTHEFKIANEDYSSEWPMSNYVLNLESYSDVVITLDVFSGEITVTSEALDCTHSYENGTCTICGEADPNYVPVVVPTITLKTPTLLLEDTIKLNIYYTIDQDIALEKMGMLTWSSKPDVVDIATAENVYPGATFNDGNGFYGVNTDGIPAQNLGDIIYFCIYAELADGSIVYGKQVQYSPVTYAYNQINGSASAEMKALLVAILNYGAAAQTYLEDTDPLVNANLTDDMKALVEAYRSDMVHSVAMPSASKQGAMAANGGFSAKKPSISLDGAFSINYYFTPSATVKGNMTFYYWNAEDFANASVLSASNATGSAVMTNNNGEYSAAIEGIAAKDVDGALYACGVYTDANGNTYSTGILPYSLGFYCGNQAKGEGALADLAAAIAVYGYYAAIYFAM